MMYSLNRLFCTGRFLPLSNKCNIHLRSALRTSAPATSNRSVDSVKRAEDIANKYATHVNEAVSRWAKNDEVYYGKERDMKNFPPVEYSEVHPKVRLGFIPDSWFQTLYPKTGVSGPYVFLFGTTTFLLSKEIWVVDPHFVEFGVFVVSMTFLVKKCAPYLTKLMDSSVEKEQKLRFEEPLDKVKNYLDKTIKTSEEEIARAAAVPSLIHAKEENLDLQLEAAYRERLQHINRAVVHRLDYHMERENARRRFQQHHLVEWVVDRVVKGITPTQEKDTLTQCIAGLRRLAQQAKPATA